VPTNSTVSPKNTNEATDNERTASHRRMPVLQARSMGGATASALALRAKAEAIPIMLGTTAMGFAKCSIHAAR
jgi:hypothetical protein